MTRDDIIRMAREAGFDVAPDEWHWLERFAALVAAALRDEMWEKAMKLVAEAAAAEREACARVCEDMKEDCGKHAYAFAIRTRGQV